MMKQVYAVMWWSNEDMCFHTDPAQKAFTSYEDALQYKFKMNDEYGTDAYGIVTIHIEK